MHIDFGTGDGAFVRHSAREAPDTLVIGVDANADNLREVSHRVSRKAARLQGDRALPPLDDPQSLVSLQRRYRDAGIDVTVRSISLEAIRALPTTWAQKLALAGRTRPFVEVRGAK